VAQVVEQLVEIIRPLEMGACRTRRRRSFLNSYVCAAFCDSAESWPVRLSGRKRITAVAMVPCRLIGYELARAAWPTAPIRTEPRERLGVANFVELLDGKV